MKYQTTRGRTIVIADMMCYSPAMPMARYITLFYSHRPTVTRPDRDGWSQAWAQLTWWWTRTGWRL